MFWERACLWATMKEKNNIVFKVGNNERAFGPVFVWLGGLA